MHVLLQCCHLVNNTKVLIYHPSIDISSKHYESLSRGLCFPVTSTATAAATTTTTTVTTTTTTTPLWLLLYYYCYYYCYCYNCYHYYYCTNLAWLQRPYLAMRRHTDRLTSASKSGTPKWQSSRTHWSSLTSVSTELDRYFTGLLLRRSSPSTSSASDAFSSSAKLPTPESAASNHVCLRTFSQTETVSSSPHHISGFRHSHTYPPPRKTFHWVLQGKLGLSNPTPNLIQFQFLVPLIMTYFITVKF